MNPEVLKEFDLGQLVSIGVFLIFIVTASYLLIYRQGLTFSKIIQKLIDKLK